MDEFKALGLCDDVLSAVASLKFSEPTDIQRKAIPLALSGSDLIAGSATGSGKTLAFGASMIRDVKKGGSVQALVLTPTRELAEQVSDSLTEFSRNKGLEVVAVYGGVSLEPQVKRLSYADIVVATPGRLLDHLNRNSLSLKGVSVLVLDEADRMWDMGFQDDVAKIVKHCSSSRQTMLFSATISPELESFSKKFMNSPVEVSVASQVDPSKLKQVYYDVRDNEKLSLLVHLLKAEDSGLVMIFSNTRRNSDFIHQSLKLNGIRSQVIHGGLSQGKRSTVLERFDDGKVMVLVCTDVAARGLDISGVSHVYNYDVPSDARDYVHRIGRTARAGSEGVAINIIASRDYDNFSNVQKHYPHLNVERLDTPELDRVRLPPRDDDRRSGGRRSGSGGRSFSRGGNGRSGTGRSSRDSRGGGRSNSRGFGGRRDSSSRSRGSDSRSRGGDSRSSRRPNRSFSRR